MDFAALADRYDELRPAGESWTELAEVTLAAIGPVRRLLDVGCGTGRFAAYAAERLGARVWGVDPSAEMLDQARARSVAGAGWRQAPAERLPFRDGWFDAVHAHLVLHLVDDTSAAIREMTRVLAAEGRCAIVTFRPEHFARFHLNPYFPSVQRIDADRFPDPAAIAEQLSEHGLDDAAVRPVTQRVELDPAALLERVRGRYISTLHLIPEGEYREGLQRLERDLAGRTAPVHADLLWALISARRPAGP
jgi:ubiquinone/menaquinone biosynthesis C-methylase UbiE